MKNQTKSNSLKVRTSVKAGLLSNHNETLVRRRGIPGLLATAAVLGLLLAAASPALAGKGNADNPGILPPQSHAYGHTYAEWSAEWWKWAVSMPLDSHPLADTADCSAGQSGHVWFLGGSFTTAEVVRNCTVPTGKAIFFPVLNTECSTVEPDPFHGDTVKELRACAKGWVDGAGGSCTIDGRAVQNLERYRVQSPLFRFGPLPENNVLFIDVPPGTMGWSVSDGYWLMLAPLSEGQHTIDFVGIFANGFTFHITYNLTVAEPAHVFPPHSHPYGKSYAQWSAEHWKWLYSMPVDHHPLYDTADISEGQSGPVWFIGGTFTPTTDGTVTWGKATRDCTVPAGKALFFPILDTECSTIEGNGTTDAELRSCAKFFQDHAYNMACTIDGLPVPNVDRFRVQSPLFTFGPLPENNVLLNSGYANAVAGSTSPSVSDGVFVMLAPLSVGAHTIHFTGALTLSTAKGDPFNFDFRLDITYNLTVVPHCR